MVLRQSFTRAALQSALISIDFPFASDGNHCALHCMSAEPYDASDSAVDAVILGSDSDCPRCHNPKHNEYHPRQPDQYAIGDICAIHETPNTPVHLVTHHTPPRPSTGGHGRPAVVVNSSRKAGRDSGTRRAQQTMCRICLLATFGHEGDITKLSQILQFFSLPVYPHHALFKCSRDPPHVHTSPEWCEHNTWLMAYIFNSRATISGRWENRGAPSDPPSTYRVDSDDTEDSELCALIDACEQKLADWEKLLQQNPGLAEKWFQEYQVRIFAFQCEVERILTLSLCRRITRGSERNEV